MLVTFNSNNSGQILMFATVARRLLEIIGKECSARGVITYEQLPEAISRLQLAIAGAAKTANTDDQPEDDDEETGRKIGLAQRAYPLIELLERTRQMSTSPDDQGFVLWQAAKDF